MPDSILLDTKKLLGVSEDDDAFDVDIVLHINTVLATLAQIGVGPAKGLMITDDTTKWSDLIEDDNEFNGVKSYVALKVRLLWDPPGTSFHLQALENQVKELEYRINTHREEESWQEPEPRSLPYPLSMIE